MRISAKVDYAVRAMCELAAHGGDAPMKAELIAAAQEIPGSFLANILADLKRAGFIRSVRGQVGGYRMARPPTEVTIADIIRAVEGPLADVRGIRPEALRFDGPAAPLRDVWLAHAGQPASRPRAGDGRGRRVRAPPGARSRASR